MFAYHFEKNKIYVMNHPVYIKSFKQVLEEKIVKLYLMTFLCYRKN